MTNTGLMGLLIQKMGYLNQRQSVLAENVANADTANYKQIDLAPFTFSDAMKQQNVGMATTDPRHIVPVSMAGVNTKTVKSDSYETTISGNSVDVEQQMMEVSKNAVEYKTVTSIYHKISGLFNIALKGNSSS
ncbi:MAG TPA: flagellar basal body rod protein FlgB [Alphaproteobacteria bacterium]|nr:flagellar basal body rod protein FlgB [Alphaproteobacteria bacterium]